MRFTKILIVVSTVLMSSAFLLLSAWGQGQWTILRDDDFGRNDGIEGDLQGVHFKDAQTGWAVGFGGLILHTTDGGKTWVKKEIEMPRPAESGNERSPRNRGPVDYWNLYFRDANVGFITGTRGAIFMTKDGGQTWVRKQWVAESTGRRSRRSRLTATWMVNDQIGFMVGENNTLLKTTDGGETWRGAAERVRVGETRNNLEAICFASPTHGWIIGSFGTLLHTTDSGETWEAKSVAGVDNNLMSIHFFDEKTGWISGQEGLILHTTDGGTTWAQQTTDVYDDLHDIIFVDKLTGWAVGTFGAVLHTTDGGQTWTATKAGRSSDLKAVHAVDKDHCWAVGFSGIIVGIEAK
jgi:photosystem II stability/assembly factor-like uncharacterized protein